jgi:hypothetical protein
LLLVKDRAVRQDHAVLAVRLDARWLVLDNRRDTPLETADLRHFQPLFTLDSRGVNLFAAPYASRALHESETDILPASDREFSAARCANSSGALTRKGAKTRQRAISPLSPCARGLFRP